MHTMHTKLCTSGPLYCAINITLLVHLTNGDDSITFQHTHRAGFGNLKISTKDGNRERGARTLLARGAV